MEDYKRYYSGRTVLVTGGAGSIGSNLVSTVADLDAKRVIVLDDLSAAYEWNIPSKRNVLFVKGSVCDEPSLRRVFSLKPEIVFHLAAFFANQNSVDYPERDLMTNGFGTLRIFQYSQLTDVDRVVYASSGCSIYGSAPLPLREEFMSMHLTTPYQISKMLGELYANFFHHHYRLKVVKTRFFNSFGPGEVPGQYRNVIPNFIFRALQGLPLPVTGTGEETRDFTYVLDIVDALLRAGYVDAAIGQEMNIASAREISILELASLVNQLTSNSAGIVHAPVRVWDTKKRLLANIDLAGALLGYKPSVRFEDGMLATVRWFKDNWERIMAAADFPPGMSAAVDGMVTKTAEREHLLASLA